MKRRYLIEKYYIKKKQNTDSKSGLLTNQSPVGEQLDAKNFTNNEQTQIQPESSIMKH